LNGRPTFPSQPYWGFTGDAATFDPSELRDKLKGRLHLIKSSPLLNAVRSALIAADAIGSGLPRTGQDIESWLGERLDETSLCDKAAIDGIICKRVKDLTSRGKWVEWNQFQLDCETLPDRALMLAPCGAGKTLAAWRWILGRVRVRPVKRVLFLYPTRATATEGFKDYVSWAPETDASLLHGTAAYDLDEMFPPTDTRAKRQFDNTDPRLFALRHWSKRVFSATVDQFFAFMSYSYGPMCLLPLLADSVIVVDEVHSFDKAMFSALLGFLKAFDVPVLCMTATMQAGRQEQIRPLLQKIYGYDQQPPDLAELADKPRYQVKQIQFAEVDRRIRDAVSESKRVLWVVNQVSRAIEAVESLANIGVSVICYHSRFKLDDRVERHRDTITAIRAGQPAAVVVSTQVCEMSLDIDADVLITEECPITSWIQRMGRCRRGRDELTKKGPGEVYVYKPVEKERVYTSDDLAGLDKFIEFLVSKPAVSQTDLESGLNQFGPKGADAPKLNSFLASGAYADAGEDTYRDVEAFNVQAVLDTEADNYLTAAKKDQPGFILPVPRKVRPTTDSRLPRWLHVADARNYDAKTGFHDKPIR
jgi:CRISPR-associated endonuclease/helicase Cas3